jgi:heat shock protein HspQ
MKQTQQQKQFKVGDLVETLIGNHLGIILDDETYNKKEEWYVVHLFGKSVEYVIKYNRLRKIS